MAEAVTDINEIRAECLGALRILERQLNLGHMDRKLFVDVRDAVIAAGEEGSTWLAHYASMYWQTQAIRVRRIAQGKNSDDSVALTKLVATIRKHPGVVDRATYEAFYETDEYDYLRRHAMEAFESAWGDGAGGVDIDKFKTRVDQLMKSIASVMELADKAVAHVIGDAPEVTYNELDQAIDAVTELWNDLYLLFSGSTVMFDLIHIPPAWRTVFTKPIL